MKHQEKISRKKLRRKVGRTLEVLIDQTTAEGGIGRSWADAPEIDGHVFVEGRLRPLPGQRVQVKITRADAHDLYGELASG